MNAKTEVGTAGGELARAPGSGRRTPHTGKEAATADESPRAGATPSSERISVDPLRATDKYRLVVPFSLRV